MSVIYSKKQINSNMDVLFKFSTSKGKYKLKVDRHDYFYLQKKTTPKFLRWLDRWNKELSTRNTPTREKITTVYSNTLKNIRLKDAEFLEKVSKEIENLDQKKSKKSKKSKKNKKPSLQETLQKISTRLENALPNSKRGAPNSYMKSIITTRFYEEALLGRLLKKKSKNLKKKIKSETKNHNAIIKKIAKINKNQKNKTTKKGILNKISKITNELRK